MADLLKVRASVAIPGQKSDLLLYDIYPTNETIDRLEFYNKVFECYGMKPIEMTDVYSDPEDVDKKFDDLETKIDKTSYKYGNKICENLYDLEDACNAYYSEKNKK